MFHRPVMLLALLIILGLSGCQKRFEPEQVTHLDDSVVQNLMMQMKQSIQKGNRLRWQGLFAENAIIEIISPQGIKYNSGREDEIRIMESYMNHGRGFDLQVMDQLIMVSKDCQSAVVIRKSVEVWLFKEKYKDISSEVEHYLEWQLVDGRPQITRMVREYNKRSVLGKSMNGHIAPMWAGDVGW